MNRLFIALTAALAIFVQTSRVQAQGQFQFNTAVVGSSAWVREALLFPGAGFPLGDFANGVGRGTNYYAQMYAGAGVVSDSTSLVPIGNPAATPRPVNFRSGLSAGYVQDSGTTTLGDAVNTLLTIPASVLPTPGGIATLQLRAWWGGISVFTTFESAAAAIGSNPNARVGWSNLIQMDTSDPGNPLEIPPNLPNTLQGFQLQAVPEPSTFALAGLGLASLLFLRRRK